MNIPTIEEVLDRDPALRKAYKRSMELFGEAFICVKADGTAILLNPEDVSFHHEIQAGAQRYFLIWMEGYAATGEQAGATSHGPVAAHSFREACEKHFKNDPNFNKKELTYWGCRLFDNAADARKAFG